MSKHKYPEIPTISIKEVGANPVDYWRICKPVIDYEKCRKCWICVDYCPEGVISKSDRGPIIDYRFCKGCGICANECRVGAIKMIKEVF